MSKTKQLLDEDRGNQPIDHDKFLDDSYQEQQYHEENKKKPCTTPRISDCCEAPVINFKERDNKDICVKCHEFCKVK